MMSVAFLPLSLQAILLKIVMPSTALLHKNKCSTYNKYASALFLFAPCIRYHYFQKAYGRGLQEMRLLKILNVSERTGMSVVLYSSEFSHTTKLGVQECTGRTFLGEDARGLKQQAFFKRCIIDRFLLIWYKFCAYFVFLPIKTEGVYNVRTQ